MNAKNFLTLIEREKLVVVVRGKSVDEAKKIVQACYEGGVKIVEITFTVPNADLLIAELKKQMKDTDAVIGAGTVLDKQTADKAISAGADFIVSPHLDLDLQTYVQQKGIAYTPGVLTPSEYVSAVSNNASLVKLFPGDVAKPEGLKALLGPFPNAKIMPTGGVSYENLDKWFSCGAVAVGAGGNLTKGAKEGNFKEITAEAKRWLQKIQEIS